MHRPTNPKNLTCWIITESQAKFSENSNGNILPMKTNIRQLSV